MKQFLPAKSVEHEETPVRYSNSEVNHLSPREVTTMLQTNSAGMWQPGRGRLLMFSAFRSVIALIFLHCVRDELVFMMVTFESHFCVMF